MLAEVTSDAPLAATESLFDYMYSFDCHTPMAGSSHRDAATAHQDILERKSDFLREL